MCKIRCQCRHYGGMIISDVNLKATSRWLLAIHNHLKAENLFKQLFKANIWFWQWISLKTIPLELRQCSSVWLPFHDQIIWTNCICHFNCQQFSFALLCFVLFRLIHNINIESKFVPQFSFPSYLMSLLQVIFFLISDLVPTLLTTKKTITYRQIVSDNAVQQISWSR